MPSTALQSSAVPASARTAPASALGAPAAAALAAVGRSAAVARRRPALVLVAGLVVVAVLLAAWWPAGVLSGLVLGVLAVLAIGRWDAAGEAPVDEDLASELGVGEDVPAAARADLERLKTDLGGDYPDFTRAARLVVSTQYASAARLQRDLALPYSRARRLLDDLERSHFVGPRTGSLPRQVLVPAEVLPAMERLFADA